MSELFLEVLNRSIAAGWLILAVLVLRLFLKGSPRWVHVLLWGLVGLRLVCPISIQSVLSLIPSVQTVSPQIMTDRTPTVSTGIPVLNNAINPVISESFAPDPAASANPLQIWIPVAAAIWVGIMVLMVLYTAFSYWRLRRKVSAAVRLRENIYQSEFVDSPFVLGLFRPRIYIPFGKEGSDFSHMIAHEQAHIVRRDHWWKPLGFFLLTVFWFHPLMWAAYILLCRDIEMACDERVIRGLDDAGRADYSQALLESSVRRTMIAACPLAFGEVGVKERVKSVLRYKKPVLFAVLASVVVCAVVAVCFLTDPVTPSLEVLPEVHSHTYRADVTLYENSSLHYTESSGDAYGHRYAVTEDMTLMLQVDAFNVSYTGWTVLGTLTETSLTKENFDGLFYENHYAADASRIRKENARAWRLVTQAETLYILLQQENGELYLACGDRNHEREPEPVVRWLFQLAIDPEGDYGFTVRSGENSVPLAIFPEGTAIGNFSGAIHWLTIDPGEDMVPFRIYRDGEEFRGYYLVFDAQTYDTLEYTFPSGLDPQTYLFQNADPTRQYIVMMVTGEEGSDQYCFGVQFPETDDVQNTVAFQPNMINVEGWVYLDTGEAVPAEIDSSAILGKIHTLVEPDEIPTQNGQANFSCVGCEYAWFEDGLVVLIDGEWIYFAPEEYPKYYLTVGMEGVSSILVKSGSRQGLYYTDDFTPFRLGEELYLETLDGLDTLRGVSVTARDADGNDLFSVRVSDYYDQREEDGTVRCGDWVITCEEETGPGMSFAGLGFGKTKIDQEIIHVPEDGASLDYHLTYGSQAIILQIGLVREDGYEIVRTIEHGSGAGTIEVIPAGNYRLFVRNWGYQNDLPGEEVEGGAMVCKLYP